MAKQKKKLETFVTPKGTFKFPYQNTPDKGPKDGSFKMEPVYRVTLILDGKDADALKKKIDDLHAKNVKESKAAWDKWDKLKKKKTPFEEGDKPYRPELDANGDETGATEFTFKMKPETKKDDGTVIRRKPVLFDAKGKTVNAKVGGGTIGKVSYYFYPYFISGTAGISMKMLAVQILDLKTWGERDAKGYGFGEEEGYEAPVGGDEPDAEGDTEGDTEGEGKEDLAF